MAGGVSHLVALPDGVEVLAGIAEPQRQPRVDAVDGHLRLGGGLFERLPCGGCMALARGTVYPPSATSTLPWVYPPSTNAKRRPPPSLDAAPGEPPLKRQLGRTSGRRLEE